MIFKFFSLIMLSMPIWANQCIQALTLDRFEPNHIPYKVASILQSFDHARIERRGSYLVLRVGDYATTSQALTEIDAVRAFYHDAYIRRCDIETSKIIYPRTEETYFRQSSVPATHPREIKQTKRTEQNSANTLWHDCQKCFAPLYLEEEEEPQIQKKHIQKTVQPAPAQPQEKSDDTFWVEAVDKTQHDKKNSKHPDHYDPTMYPTIKQDMVP